MLNCSAEPLDSTNILKALAGKLDIKRHSPCILHLLHCKIELICLILFIFGISIVEI